METRGNSRGIIRLLKRLCFIDMLPSSFIMTGDIQATEEILKSLEFSGLVADRSSELGGTPTGDKQRGDDDPRAGELR